MERLIKEGYEVIISYPKGDPLIGNVQQKDHMKCRKISKLGVDIKCEKLENKAAAKQIHAQLRLFLFSNSQILDNHNFSIFLFTNSLKSLPFSKFLESRARS